MATDGRPRTYTPAQRDEALQCYTEAGPAEASRRLGIPSATIRQWAHRAGLTEIRRDGAQAATEAARLTWQQRKAELTVRLGEAAATMLERALATDKAREERDHMAAVAMAVDRAQLLDGGATGRIEHTEAERRQRVRELRDELAVRRDTKAAG